MIEKIHPLTKGRNTMKAIVTVTFIIAFAASFMAPRNSYAQAADTVIVYANPTGETFEQQIMGDTTATGQRVNPNTVYVLQQTTKVDTPYYFTDPILVRNYNLTIIGRRNPVTGMPPVIQPIVRQNNTYPSNLISASTPGTIKLEHLYILGTAPDSDNAIANLINESGDSSTLILDHDVIDNCNGSVGNFSGNWDSFYMTNCENRNASNQFWQSGGAMWALYGVPMDTVKILDNTFFCMGRQAYGGPGYYKYLDLNHNTFFLSCSGLLLSSHLTNANISNNIFYGVEAHGADSTYIRSGGANDAKQGFGIVMTDSLRTVGTQYGVSEAQRTITVDNNVYYWPDTLLNLYKAIDDTAKGWTVVPPIWMNAQTAYMFSNHTAWPGFKAANNDSVDPGFSSSLVTPSVDSLIKFILGVGWNTPYGSLGNAGVFRWWQLQTNPYYTGIFAGVPKTWNGWNSGYPVPENLAFSNSQLTTASLDGKPVGDLNWFPSQLPLAVKTTGRPVPSAFTLSQNYPNPFNPTTEVKFSLAHAGVISLTVYNVLGQVVSVVAQGYKPAGQYTYSVNMDRFASGVYFYSLREGANVITKKMLLLK